MLAATDAAARVSWDVRPCVSFTGNDDASRYGSTVMSIACTRRRSPSASPMHNSSLSIKSAACACRSRADEPAPRPVTGVNGSAEPAVTWQHCTNCLYAVCMPIHACARSRFIQTYIITRLILCALFRFAQAHNTEGGAQCTRGRLAQQFRPTIDEHAEDTIEKTCRSLEE